MVRQKCSGIRRSYLDIKDEQQSCRIHLTFPEDAPKDVFYETATGECQ